MDTRRPALHRLGLPRRRWSPTSRSAVTSYSCRRRRAPTISSISPPARITTPNTMPAVSWGRATHPAATSSSGHARHGCRAKTTAITPPTRAPNAPPTMYLEAWFLSCDRLMVILAYLGIRSVVLVQYPVAVFQLHRCTATPLVQTTVRSRRNRFRFHTPAHALPKAWQSNCWCKVALLPSVGPIGYGWASSPMMHRCCEARTKGDREEVVRISVALPHLPDRLRTSSAAFRVLPVRAQLEHTPFEQTKAVSRSGVRVRGALEDSGQHPVRVNRASIGAGGPRCRLRVSPPSSHD